MRRLAIPLLVVLALAGCGGKQASAPPPPTTTTAAAPPQAKPTLTTPTDREACAVLQTKIRLVSALVSSSVEFMTQSLHPN